MASGDPNNSQDHRRIRLRIIHKALTGNASGASDPVILKNQLNVKVTGNKPVNT